MGTNFYWKALIVREAVKQRLQGEEATETDDMDPRFHIGKRSAAGLYCWDCNQTLCAAGVTKIHYTPSKWLKCCPKCGARRQPESLTSPGPVGVELGFAKPRIQRPQGVRGCSSFTWAQDPCDFIRLARKLGDDNPEAIADEYGREMSVRDFRQMLKANCPVRFSAIGEWFG